MIRATEYRDVGELTNPAVPAELLKVADLYRAKALVDRHCQREGVTADVAIRQLRAALRGLVALGVACDERSPEGLQAIAHEPVSLTGDPPAASATTGASPLFELTHQVEQIEHQVEQIEQDDSAAADTPKHSAVRETETAIESRTGRYPSPLKFDPMGPPAVDNMTASEGVRDFTAWSAVRGRSHKRCVECGGRPGEKAGCLGRRERQAELDARGRCGHCQALDYSEFQGNSGKLSKCGRRLLELVAQTGPLQAPAAEIARRIGRGYDLTRKSLEELKQQGLLVGNGSVTGPWEFTPAGAELAGIFGFPEFRRNSDITEEAVSEAAATASVCEPVARKAASDRPIDMEASNAGAGEEEERSDRHQQQHHDRRGGGPRGQGAAGDRGAEGRAGPSARDPGRDHAGREPAD